MTAVHLSYSGAALELFSAAEDAVSQVPPAFPLEATVAVNPFLGQLQEPRTEAAARLARTAGVSLTRGRADVAAMLADGRITEHDLSRAAVVHGLNATDLRKAASSTAPVPTPLPTVAELAARIDGISWTTLIEDRFGTWAGAHFDVGQAMWAAPRTAAYAAWQSFARRDLTPEIAGLAGFAARVAALPSNPRHAFADTCEVLGIGADAAPLYFHRLLMTLSGWSQYARHLGWLAERDGTRDETLFELLTIRLIWEAALLETGSDALAKQWDETRTEYAKPLQASADEQIDLALQEAVDRAAERTLATALATPVASVTQIRPAIQAAFCIDVRSEILRRGLEAADPGIATIGFAGFFGLPVAHRGHASDVVEARSPILLKPAVETVSSSVSEDDAADRIYRRALRAWGRFKRATVSAFAFVEAAGPLYVGKLVRDACGLGAKPGIEAAPRLDLPVADRVATAAKVLRAMSLTDRFAPLILIAGHGAGVTNAPHASALQCGACGGHAGDVNARLLAGLLNDADVREGLRAEGIEIPADTRFVAGLHDTVSDWVTLYADGPAPDAGLLERLRGALETAGTAARTERALNLPRADDETQVPGRGTDWSEVRPEWGLAGCAAFIAAPRHRTAGLDFGGRAFLHDYQWQQDEDHATLELILTAPVVVASWIALQYHGSSVAPDAFGAGNKLLHNVVGGIGVLEGNGGPLRTGLPWQSVHDGDTLRHAPQRLNVVIEAPATAIQQILDRNPGVQALFDNGWLALFTMDGSGQLAQRYEPVGWQSVQVDRQQVAA